MQAAYKNIISTLVASFVGIVLFASMTYGQGVENSVTNSSSSIQVEEYLDRLIMRASIAGDAASVIREADAYRSVAREKLKTGQRVEARVLFRKAGELIAAAAPDGDVKQQDPLLRDYLSEITNELLSLDVPARMSLSAETNHLSSSQPRVAAFLIYFQSRGRGRLEIGRSRLSLLRPMMAQVFREEGVPEWLLSVGFVESTYNTSAHSPAQAHGIWQFIPGTGQRYGLTRTAWTDERAHPEKSTRAAARYLRDLHALFGDWLLALAAYNWGEGRVARVTQRTGIRDFWTLADRGLMPQETINYVPAVLAASQLLLENKSADQIRATPTESRLQPGKVATSTRESGEQPGDPK